MCSPLQTGTYNELSRIYGNRVHGYTYLSMILVPYYNSRLHLLIYDPSSLLQFTVTPTYS